MNQYTGISPSPAQKALIATSRVELYISCNNLTKEDLLSKSDPFAVLYMLPVDGINWVEYGRTETIDDTQNPTFTKPFILDYSFSTIQQLKIEVYDRDSPSESLNQHDYQGGAEFSLGRVIGAKGQSMTLKLQDLRKLQSSASFRSKDLGTITIRAEEITDCKDVLTIQFSGKGLDRKNGFFFGKSDPFLYISRSREDGTWLRVWTSEVIQNTLNPVWKEAQIPLQIICNGDRYRPILIECYDWEKSGDHQFIGSFQTTIHDLSVEAYEKVFLLFNAERQKKKGRSYAHSGEIQFTRFQISQRYSFLEYLRGGCELNLIVAMDYTASNGDPSQPQSLHYQNPQVYNQYQQAISATGGILREYDSDQLFPVFGFGGQVNGRVDHCFPLSWNASKPEVAGIDGILQAYRNSFQYVTLSGPTLFAPVIQTASTMASQFITQECQKYFILLIITDGVIMDMPQTIDAIVNASHLPLSIVIVGVGNADFTAMEVLDSDNKVLKSSAGQPAARDIVQFVPFLKYRDHPAKLAEDTLAEIPTQLSQYMSSRGLVPNPPVAVSIPPIVRGNSVSSALTGTSDASAQEPPPCYPMYQAQMQSEV